MIFRWLMVLAVLQRLAGRFPSAYKTNMRLDKAFTRCTAIIVKIVNLLPRALKT